MLGELPSSVSEAIEGGANPLRAIREWRGYDVMAASVASGVLSSIILEHEEGKRDLTPDECEALGTALGVSAGLLRC